MLQRHQRHHVAVRRQVGAGIEERLQVRHILAAFDRRHALARCPWHYRVAHVHLVAGSAGDVPAAPPLFQGAAMVSDKAARLRDRHAVPIWKNRPNHQARHSQRRAGLVALETGIAPFELRMSGRILIERVEANALLRVERREFQDITRAHETNSDVIAEIEGARRARRNARGLETGF